jgi:uncharacterized protein (TIGR02284 family)
MEFKLFKASPFILEKVNLLCRLLWQGKKEYELVAANISDKELRRAILTLAQGNNQYANELSSLIETLGGVPPKENMHEPEQEISSKIFRDENEILVFCKMNETKMLEAYREILNESFLYDGLRKMIRYQLNGILCAFTQLKLLDSFGSFKESAQQFVL